MKKILFAVAALFISTMSFAQGFGGGFGGGQGMNMNPEDMAKRQADRLKEQLTLTQVQYDSIYNMYLASSKEQAARREQMQNGGQQGQGDMQAMMEQMQKQREAQDAKIKSFLTDAQKKTYDELQEQRRQRQGQGGFGGGQGAPQGGFGGGRPQGGQGAPQGGRPRNN
ncbi:MAG: hypothetical protein IK006_03305 [Bacteroidaceae bacterium]|nr:hypothetical protein [Bacteroidaceae bacterium]